MIAGALTEAIGIVFSWPTFIWIVLGIFIGFFFGALPGIGASLGMAIVLPLTIPMSGIDAIVLLVGIYSGAMYGGSIAAILVNVPGTPAAAATTFDGYPMSRQGRAKDALAISAVSSSIGGILTIIALFMISPFLVEIVLLFGSPEYFLIAILGLSMIVTVSRGSVLKGLTAGAFGLLLTTFGIGPIDPTLRFTFGQLALYDGLSFIAVLIGIFAITEMIILSAEQGSIAQQGIEISGSILRGARTAISQPVTILKSSFIGMGIGAMPGAGAAVSNFLAYGEAMRSSSDPDSFGAGNPTGVVASESSNNGTVGGSLIPTLSFGIPGSPSTAVFLGGLIMHGLRPGPDLFTSQLAQTYSMFFALLIGSVVIMVAGTLAVTRLAVITQIDSNFIVPMIIVLATLGALTLRNNWVDIATIVVFGIVGLYLRKHDYSFVAFVLGVVLGGIAEENLLRSLQLSGGSFSIFVQDPLSLLIVLSIVFILVGSGIKPAVAAVKDRLG